MLPALVAGAGAAQTIEPSAGTNAAPALVSAAELERAQEEAARARADAAAAHAAAAEAQATFTRHSTATDARLRDLESSLLAQRAQELQELRAAHRFTLWVAGSLAVVGLVAVLSLVVLLWRLLARRPGAALAYGGGAAGEAGLVLVNPIEQANARFLHAIEQLEQRIRDMETGAPVTPLKVSPAAPAAGEPAPGPGAGPRPSGSPAAEPVTALLSKGQSLMHLGQVDAALQCFAEALALEPANPEAHLKKAAALEKLDRLDEALREYDAALARDSTLTMAYLGKGSVFNRLERHGEALRCYEQALHTQHHAGVAE